jgi:hypothetical protein
VPIASKSHTHPSHSQTSDSSVICNKWNT